VEPRIVTGLDHGVAEIVGVKQDHHLDASRGLELPDELRRQLRGLGKGEPQGHPVFFLDVESDARGDDMVTVGQDSTDIAVPADIGITAGFHRATKKKWLKRVR
jgi:hypothetical protein